VQGAEHEAADQAEVSRLALSGKTTELEKHLSARSTRLHAAQAVHGAIVAAVEQQRSALIEARKLALVEILVGARPGHARAALDALAALRQLIAACDKLTEATADLERLAGGEPGSSIAPCKGFPLIDPQLLNRLRHNAAEWGPIIEDYARGK
jgi:hypothetical protein